MKWCWEFPQHCETPELCTSIVYKLIAWPCKEVEHRLARTEKIFQGLNRKSTEKHWWEIQDKQCTLHSFFPLKVPKGLWTSNDLPAGGGSPELCWDRRGHWWQPTCWEQSQRSGNRRKGWSKPHVAKRKHKVISHKLKWKNICLPALKCKEYLTEYSVTFHEAIGENNSLNQLKEVWFSAETVGQASLAAELQ